MSTRHVTEERGAKTAVPAWMLPAYQRQPVERGHGQPRRHLRSPSRESPLIPGRRSLVSSQRVHGPGRSLFLAAGVVPDDPGKPLPRNQGVNLPGLSVQYCGGKAARVPGPLSPSPRGLSPRLVVPGFKFVVFVRSAVPLLPVLEACGAEERKSLCVSPS